jgi:hypothetical protein
MKPQDFIGKKATYFEYGTQIFGENEKGELQMILDVRGGVADSKKKKSRDGVSRQMSMSEFIHRGTPMSLC